MNRLETANFLRVVYTNYKGETAERTLMPMQVWFGSTDWHPEPQWLLTAFDVDKQANRDFALKDFGHPASNSIASYAGMDGFDLEAARIGRAAFGRLVDLDLIADTSNDADEAIQLIAALSPLPQASSGLTDKDLLDALADNHWDIRSVSVPTGAGDADVDWVVIEHHLPEPQEREVAMAHCDDPRAAIRRAIRESDKNAERCVSCDNVLHDGDSVYYEHSEGGHIHYTCASDDPSDFVDVDEAPLKDGAPIPEPFAFNSEGRSDVDLSERCATYEEILRVVCHHLELPQSESGPADDLRLYDRALSAADEYTSNADADLAENRRLRFKAEAELYQLRAACKPFVDAAEKLPDHRVLHEKSPFWREAEIEWLKAAQLLTTGQFREILHAYEISNPTPAATVSGGSDA